MANSRTTPLIAAMLMMALIAPSAQAGLRDRIRERMAERMEGQIAADQTLDGREMAYGRDALQSLAFWAPAARSKPPRRSSCSSMAAAGNAATRPMPPASARSRI